MFSLAEIQKVVLEELGENSEIGAKLMRKFEALSSYESFPKEFEGLRPAALINGSVRSDEKLDESAVIGVTNQGPVFETGFWKNYRYLSLDEFLNLLEFLKFARRAERKTVTFNSNEIGVMMMDSERKTLLVPLENSVIDFADLWKIVAKNMRAVGHIFEVRKFGYENRQEGEMDEFKIIAVEASFDQDNSMEISNVYGSSNCDARFSWEGFDVVLNCLRKFSETRQIYRQIQSEDEFYTFADGKIWVPKFDSLEAAKRRFEADVLRIAMRLMRTMA
jgi:hypothetical protein